MTRKVSITAPANIAFIKYWGTRDLESTLPYNPSISMTSEAGLTPNPDASTTCTEIVVSAELPADSGAGSCCSVPRPPEVSNTATYDTVAGGVARSRVLMRKVTADACGCSLLASTR